MRNIVLIICFLIIHAFFFTSFAKAQNTILKTSISFEWSIDEIRQKTFEGIEYVKDVSMFSSKDPNYKENQDTLKRGNTFIKNRFVTFFSDNSYGIDIFDNSTFNKSFIYDLNGNLVFICFQKFSKNIKNVDDYYRSILDNSIYPKKVYRYSYPKGDLIGVSYDINVNNQYVFKPDGKFIEYWIDDNCYDSEGNLVLQRGTKPFIKE